jgi:uncharacterized BrkB/YihY/UPF0761 family membrane protein
MVIGTGILLMALTIVNTSLDLVAVYATRLPWSDTVWPLALPVLMASGTVLLFTMLYRFLPRAPLDWSDVWPGAIVGGIGWEVLKKGFVWYAGTMADWGAIYGSIASVIALSLWLYLSAQVVLYGAEFSAAYSRLIRDKSAVAFIPVEKEPLVEPDEALPDETEKRTSLARGTAVGLVGAGAAGGLLIVGLVASGWRLLTRRPAATKDEDTPHIKEIR